MEKDEYMITKIREWARHGVIDKDYEVERLVVYGVPIEAALVLATQDTLADIRDNMPVARRWHD